MVSMNPKSFQTSQPTRELVWTENSEDDYVPVSTGVVQIYFGSEEKIGQSDGNDQEGDGKE